MIQHFGLTQDPRILIVDDNDDNRYTLKLYLDLEGFSNVEVANDGEEAIIRLDKHAFDLVLLDVMMPKVDGYEVLAWIKTQPKLNGLPVIMVSALDEINSVVRCIELGAVDYLLKPFNKVLLKARLSATLEKKRLRDAVDTHLAQLQSELEAARKLQMGMVPQFFPSPTDDFPIDICASMEPAREVGGDLYDFFCIDDDKLCFLVGDVSGKGLPAALFMARTKALIRITAELMRQSDGQTASPSDIIGRVNRELCQDNDDLMFVTLFFAMIALRSGEVAFCNAGHNAPYLLSEDRFRAIDEDRNIILGVRSDTTYKTARLTLAHGETLYIFTDGVTEAMNRSDELFSEARLEEVLRGATGGTSASIINTVTNAVNYFVGDASASDDITMLALRRVQVATQ